MCLQNWVHLYQLLQYIVAMDRIDENILHELLHDGRMTNSALAAKVGLSPSACLRRVQELERSGIIKGFRAVLDRQALGKGFLAYIGVGLKDHTKESQAAFERAIAATPEVLECHNVTGTIEFLLRVEVPDLAAYKIFHTDVLGAIPQVNAITSYIVMSSPKDLRS